MSKLSYKQVKTIESERDDLLVKQEANVKPKEALFKMLEADLRKQPMNDVEA